MTSKVKLGEVATYINGYAFKPTDWENAGREIIRIQNLTKSSKEKNYYSKSIDDKYIVRSGDVLISWSGTLGLFEWEGKEGVLNQHIFKVVFDKLPINKYYFKYVVAQALIQSGKNSHGSTMKHLTKKNFDAIEISYPSLEEQDRIATNLAKVDNLIHFREVQLVQYDHLVKS